jgi:excinuclease UvrABC ATPase subunit
MIWFIKNLFWKRICSLCDGLGWVKVDYREGSHEHLKCCVCSGKGTL